jgi:hypothetical protein
MRPVSLPIAISAVLVAIAFAQSQSPIQLEAEKTFDRKLAAGGTDLFTLDLKTDQIVELKLEDRGTDVILSVYSPDRRLSRAFSSARQKGDALEFLASQPGRWELKVAAREGNAPASYKISDLTIGTPHAPAVAEEDVSPRIRKITNQAEADAFWKEIGPNGSPLISKTIPSIASQRFFGVAARTPNGSCSIFATARRTRSTVSCTTWKARMSGTEHCASTIGCAQLIC